MDMLSIGAGMALFSVWFGGSSYLKYRNYHVRQHKQATAVATVKQNTTQERPAEMLTFEELSMLMQAEEAAKEPMRRDAMANRISRGLRHKSLSQEVLSEYLMHSIRYADQPRFANYMKECLRRNINVNQPLISPYTHGRNPIRFAIHYCRPEAVAVLLNTTGLDIHKKERGETLLQEAQARYNQMVQLASNPPDDAVFPYVKPSDEPEVIVRRSQQVLGLIEQKFGRPASTN